MNKMLQYLHILLAVLCVAVILVFLVPIPGITEFFQYLYYLRAPVLASLLLFFLPVICIYAVPDILANMFALYRWWHLALVISGAVAVGLGLVLIDVVIVVNASARFGIADSQWLEHSADSNSLWPYFVAILLGAPTGLAAYWSSGPNSEEMSEQDRKQGLQWGLALSGLFLLTVWGVRNAANTATLVELALTKLFTALVGYIPIQKGYLTEDGQLTAGHAVLGHYLLVVSLLYVIGLWVFRPRSPVAPSSADANSLPVLSYVLGLIQIFGLLFGFLSFWMDVYLLPVLLILLCFSWWMYRKYRVDHYYDMPLKADAAQALVPSDALQALKNRLAKRGQSKKPLVVVCASGGGIQAAGWTTKVLSGLQQELGDEFAQSIGLISSVSGGSVGALYYIDRFELAKGYPLNDSHEAIFQASTADSLSAVGWGLAYPDMWRFVGLPFLNDWIAIKPRDRAQATNWTWQSRMTKPEATLQDWAGYVSNGDIPLTVFNATVVDDGRQFLLSPLTFGGSAMHLEFNALYPQYNINASTAALLSATFPYVTPIMRNAEPKQGTTFHVADGGYFDNFGVVSAVDWLDRLILSQDQGQTVDKVFWIEIKAFPVPKLQSTYDRQSGWLMALLGPVQTILNARNSTQDQRNADDVSDLIDEWQGKVEIKRYDIAFPENIQFFEAPSAQDGKSKALLNSVKASFDFEEKAYNPPLSWKLSKKQRDKISQAWQTVKHSGDCARLLTDWRKIK